MLEQELEPCWVCNAPTLVDDLLEIQMLSIRVEQITLENASDFRRFAIASVEGENGEQWEARQVWRYRKVCTDCAHICGWCDEAYAISQGYRDNEMFDDRFAGDHYADFRSRTRWAGVGWQYSEELCHNCANNAYNCDHCGDLAHSDDISRVQPYEEVWCEQCRLDDATWCDDCDDYVADGHPCSCREQRVIHDYSFKPDPIFRNPDGSTPDWREVRSSKVPYLGFELEVESENGDLLEGALLAREFRQNESLFYLKTDGSPNRGFEIVTHPMALEYHQKVDYSFIKTLGANGFRAFRTDTCGLHVHISRRGFSGRSHIWKFGYLVANNEDEMSRLAGRNSSRWASFGDLKSTVSIETKTPWHGRTARYQAINFLNADTLELRFFKASLRVERVLSALELTHAMAEYTRPLTSRDVVAGALDWYNFARWVLAHKDEYPNLNHYVKTFGLANAVYDDSTLVSTKTVEEEF